MGGGRSALECSCDARAKKTLNVAFALCKPHHLIHKKCNTTSRHKAKLVTGERLNQYIVTILNNSEKPTTAVSLLVEEEKYAICKSILTKIDKVLGKMTVATLAVPASDPGTGDTSAASLAASAGVGAAALETAVSSERMNARITTANTSPFGITTTNNKSTASSTSTLCTNNNITSIMTAAAAAAVATATNNNTGTATTKTSTSSTRAGTNNVNDIAGINTATNNTSTITTGASSATRPPLRVSIASDIIATDTTNINDASTSITTNSTTNTDTNTTTETAVVSEKNSLTPDSHDENVNPEEIETSDMLIDSTIVIDLVGDYDTNDNDGDKNYVESNDNDDGKGSKTRKKKKRDRTKRNDKNDDRGTATDIDDDMKNKDDDINDNNGTNTGGYTTIEEKRDENKNNKSLTSDKYWEKYKLHLSKNNFCHRLEQLNYNLFHYYQHYNFRAMLLCQNEFDTQLVDSFDVKTDEAYTCSRKLLDQHFIGCNNPNTYHSRSQHQYCEAVHYLNKRLMDGQIDRIYRKKILLWKNMGTNDGLFDRVNYNKEEQSYSRNTTSALGKYKVYQDKSNNVATEDPTDDVCLREQIKTDTIADVQETADLTKPDDGAATSRLDTKSTEYDDKDGNIERNIDENGNDENNYDLRNDAKLDGSIDGGINGVKTTDIQINSTEVMDSVEEVVVDKDDDDTKKYVSKENVKSQETRDGDDENETEVADVPINTKTLIDLVEECDVDDKGDGFRKCESKENDSRQLKNNFDVVLVVDSFPVYNFHKYEFAINEINKHFNFGSQEEYAAAIHRLNARMMATQNDMYAKHRMRLLPSHGTLNKSERVYQRVPFNKEEREYSRKVLGLLCCKRRREKLKKEKTDVQERADLTKQDDGATSRLDRKSTECNDEDGSIEQNVDENDNDVNVLSQERRDDGDTKETEVVDNLITTQTIIDLVEECDMDDKDDSLRKCESKENDSRKDMTTTRRKKKDYVKRKKSRTIVIDDDAATIGVEDDEVMIVGKEQMLESRLKMRGDTCSNTNDDDAEIQVLGSIGNNALSDFCHAREDCVTKPFRKDPTAYCSQCYCYVCDVQASACTDWEENHCHATRHAIQWRRRRSKLRCKRTAPERTLQRLQTWSDSITTEQQQSDDIVPRRKRLRRNVNYSRYC